MENIPIKPRKLIYPKTLAAAGPSLLEALSTITEHAQETYPHFESDRGQRDIAQALAAIAEAEGNTP